MANSMFGGLVLGCLEFVLAAIGAAAIVAAVLACNIGDPGARAVGIGVCLLAAAVSLGFLARGFLRE